jgi:F0F1-type ATP synthase alpha subunit
MIDVERVGKFESDIYASLEEEKTILSAIESEKIINEETEKNLKDLIEKVAQLYK